MNETGLPSGSRRRAAWSMFAYAILYNVVLWTGVGLALLLPQPRRMAAAVAAFFLGAALGSFGNQAAYRLPRRMGLSFPPSSCPRCGAVIRRRHNLPILGWLILRGRCADCGAPISWQYPAVELLVAVGCAVAAYGAAAWLES